MKKAQIIFERGAHRWIVVARDPERPGHVIDTNEYVIEHGGQALLTDPGGSEIFPAVFAALGRVMDPRTIRGIFASHQDPDVISSLGLWLEIDPTLRCHASRLWTTFIPHFGGDGQTMAGIPDQGGPLDVGGLALEAVPAHYLHSSGNFHLYDPVARILFTGDIGAALLPPDRDSLYVEDFDNHIRYARGFHERWMGSNEAKRAWLDRVAKLQIDMLCPQHGAIYRGADVGRFLQWFSELRVGLY
jgi:flavorubredoxin